MPVKQQQRQQVNTFIGGFVTEGSPLNFPQEATKYEQNFEIDRRGFRSRRLGMEEGEILVTGEEISSGTEVEVFIWKGAGGDTSVELLVVQKGDLIHFFDYTKTPYSLITNLEIEGVNTTVSFASVDGKLVFVDGREKVNVVTYNKGTVEHTTGSLKIRDLWGIEEEAPYEEDQDYRGENLPKHKYNLQNQSWGKPRYTEVTVPTYRYEQVERPNPSYDPSKPPSPLNPLTVIVTERRQVGETKTSLMADPVEVYFDHYKKAPSNREQVWQGIQMQAVTKEQVPFEKMFPELFEQVLGMYPESAKGYFIIDALNRGQSRQQVMGRNTTNYPALVSYYPQFPADKTNGGPRVVAGFAGRMFYSGISGEIEEPDKRSVSYYDAVLFSQLVNTHDDLFKCYQEGDPTSREGHDVVDTDGGMIKVSGMHGLVDMIPAGNSLILLATNGIWAIKGGGNYGFTATNYSVEKLSTYGCVGRSSIVTVGEEIVYWSNDGIYRIGKDQYGDFVVNSISISLIHQYYNSFSAIQKRDVTGSYDEYTNTIIWLIQSEDITEELKLDMMLGVFSRHVIKTTSGRRVVKAFPRSGILNIDVEANVMSGESEVMAGDLKVVTTLVEEAVNPIGIEYLVIRNNGNILSVARKTRQDFKDWGLEDATGIIETGDNIVGDMSVDKQINYLDVFVKREESWGVNGEDKGSSCFVTTKWNFSDKRESGKWSTKEQVFRATPSLYHENSEGRFETPFYVQKTRITPRGTGVAVSIRYETEEGKNCTIYGWSISWTGNPIT